MTTTEELFVEKLRPWADWCSARTNVHPNVILAQWANETGWGSSEAWRVGHNPAGVSPNGSIAQYSTVQEGMDAYVQTMNLSYYDAVRAAHGGGELEQAVALGESPWAASHYNDGNGPGSSLLVILKDYLGVPVHSPAPPPADPWYHHAIADVKYTKAIVEGGLAWLASKGIGQLPTDLEWQAIANRAYADSIAD